MSTRPLATPQESAEFRQQPTGLARPPRPDQRHSRWWTRLAAVLVLGAAGYSAHAATAASLEAYGRLPSLEMVAIAPDGSRLAFIHNAVEDRSLVVLGIRDHKAIGRFRLGDLKVRQLAWADATHLLVTTSVTTVPWEFRHTREWMQLLVCDTATWRSQVVPAPPGAGEPRLLNALLGKVMLRTVNGRSVVFLVGVGAERGRAYPVLLRRDLDSGRQRVIAEGDGKTRDWLVDLRGEIAAELDYDEERQRWSLAMPVQGHPKEVASGQAAVEVPRLVGIDGTGEHAVVQVTEGDRMSWKLLSLSDGSIAPEPEAMARLTEPVLDHATHRMAGGTYVDDSTRLVFFDAARQAQWEAIVRAFDGDQVRYVSASDDFRKVVVRVDGPSHGYEYELVDLDTGQALPIGDIQEGITHRFETRRITFSARDGLQIPAYVTLPRAPGSPSSGGAAVALPLVVLVHGGPLDRDTAEFDWLSQALADQGYAVLQANFRGSDLDRDFMRAGFGEFGRRMQSDLVDGVRHLAGLGLADPARVCIAGMSYGGFAALAGVTLDTSTYRCAVSVAGLSDLRSFLLRVQSAAMYRSLGGLGKQSELVELEHEDHWLSHGATRLKMLRAAVRFLRLHNPPDSK